MMNIGNELFISLILLHLGFWFWFCSSSSSDTITIDKPITDGELLISKSRKFALGFFSPGKSTKRYVGIWFHNLPRQTVVWVANRDNPINDTSGVLSINPHGNMELHNKHSNFPVWFTNVPVTDHPNNKVIAQLLDMGNFILTQNNSGAIAIIWQSFDHPTDTLLPCQKFGFNRKTGQSWFLQSWKTEDDPGTGRFIFNFSKSGRPQIFLYNQNLKWWRGGSFQGEKFTAMPPLKRFFTKYNFSFVDDGNEVAVTYRALDKAIVREVIPPSGSFQSLVWDYQKNQWSRYWSAPDEQCDYYGTCGSNSICEILLQCSCLPGFEPKNLQDWYQNRDFSGGCVKKRNGRSVCGNREGFVKVESLKIPDTSVAIAKMKLTMEQCHLECLRNCSCVAYAAADVRNGGIGCLAWYGDLMDTQKIIEAGQDLYIRVDAFELASYARKSKRVQAMKIILVILMASIAAIALPIALCMCCYIRKRKRTDSNKTRQYLDQVSPTEDEHGDSTPRLNLPFFHFETVADATNNFASDNELGRGGFGSVYKGILANGQKIAVKRLSMCSGQGAQEFENEVKLIIRLQHRNLGRLFGYCIHKQERMLIYEYLPNKSLDIFLFDMTQRLTLNWDKRFEIIFGIARGVLYLHQDSRLKIIHRDLKVSNILLDVAMNSKISDFGIAKIFGDNQIQTRTRRVVGTYGYMSPEYVMEGRYSTKSDVFSFGVLLLEIISGKRNTDREKGRASLNLIGQVWDLWREGKTLDIVDSTLGQSFPAAVVLRCIQIGLLCVQERALNRPSMSEVVFMLGNETSLPSPQKPAFIFNSNNDLVESSTSKGGSSVNEVTTTAMSAR